MVSWWDGISIVDEFSLCSQGGEGKETSLS
jgi:hypothetical protein